MKNFKKFASVMVILLMLTSLFAACAQTNTAEEPSSQTSEPEVSTDDVTSEEMGKLKVGFSELAVDGAWRIAQAGSMQTEAEARGYEFVMTNAQQSAEKQVSDVEDLLAQDIDFLFITAIDVEAIVPALDAAKEKGVPVILLDREANGTPGIDFVTTIISDYKWQGQQSAEWIYSTLGDVPIKVVEITGKVGGSDVRDRAQGFRDGMANHSNMEIIASQTANWKRDEAKSVMENIIQSTGGDFNVVYAHNDDMALGAILALKAAGLTPNEDVYVVTIDGQKEAVESVINGELSCIVTCSPRFGKAAMDTMEAYLDGEEIATKIINPETIIDDTNAEAELPNAF